MRRDSARLRDMAQLGYETRLGYETVKAMALMVVLAKVEALKAGLFEQSLQMRR